MARNRQHRLVERILERTIAVTLANGFTVLLSPDSDKAGVSLTLGVKAGYFDEPQHLAGISHLLEHVFCGLANASVIARRPSRPCGISGSTIYNHTTYTTPIASIDLALALEAMSEAYWARAADHESFEREQSVVLHESARKADSSRATIVEQLYGQLFPAHPIGRWRVGTADSIRGLSAKDVEMFRAAYYQPANSVLSLAGDFDIDLALRLIDNSFGLKCACPNAPPRRALVTEDSQAPSRNSIREKRAIALPRFVIGWRTPGVSSEEAPLFDVVAALVSQDKQLQRLEQRRLGLNADAMHYIPGDVGVFVVRAEALPDTLEEVVEVVCRSVDRLTLRRPSATQLDHAKFAIAGSWAAELTRQGSRGRCLAEWHMLSSWSMALTTFRGAMSATPAIVHGVAESGLHASLRALRVHVPERRTMSREFVISPKPQKCLPTRVDRRPRAHVTKYRVLEEHTTSAAISLYRSVSGVPILVAPSDSTDGLVSVGLYIRGGKSDESRDVAGITKALVGTLSLTDYLHRRPNLMQKARAIAFAVTPVVDLNYFGWSVRVRPSQVSDTMDLLSAFVQEVAVRESALGEHQFRALGRAARSHESAMHSSLAAALRGAYGDHPYGLPDNGLAKSLRNLTVATVSRWREQLFCRPRLAFAVVGPAKAAAIRLAKLDTDLPSRIERPPHLPSWPAQSATVCEHRSWRETGLCMLFPIGGLSAVEAPLHDLIATLAGGRESRLVNELRFRKALCYVASGFVRVRELAGVIGICAETAPADISECRDTITQELLRLAHGDIDEAAFQGAKQSLSKRWETQAPSVEGRVHDLLVNWFFRNRVACGEYACELGLLSLESVVGSLRSWTGASKPVVGLAGLPSSLSSVQG